MKLSTKLAFFMFVLFSIMVSIAYTKKAQKSKAHKSHTRSRSRVLPNLTPMATYITDKSSIWNPTSTVDLLIELSKVLTKPEVSDKVSLKQFNDVLADCLGNLKNLGGKWGNNMRYFWNIVTDYIKTKNDKAIVEKTFEEAFAMCASQKVNAPSLTGQLCGKVFVMAFDEKKAKKVIDEFLKKFNLVPPKTPLITSFIGAHRNIAPAGFFKKMNGRR
jgi:hypothetical protein